MSESQLERIDEIAERLKDLSKSYSLLVNTLPEDATPELLSMVEMSGELTIENLKRSATLLEVLYLAKEKHVESCLVPENSPLLRPYVTMRREP